MDTLAYILNKYHITDTGNKMPIEIPQMIRNDLPGLFNELGFRVGAEIGVESGVYSDILLRTMHDVQLYSIDAWKSYRAYRDHTSQIKLDRFYAETQAILNKYGSRSIIMKNSSEEALSHFADNSLDFVYIDANHDFEHVAFDVHRWLRKVRPGGIISGHDYKKHKPGVNIHVKQVINAYTDAYYIKPWFVAGSQAKNPGDRRDDSRSWFWVKV